MEFASGIAGAALGFIHGNTRGALKGFRVGKHLYQKRMAPIRKRKYNRTPPPTPRKPRRAVGAPTRTTSSAAVVGSSRAVSRKVNRISKGVKFKKPAKVRVTKKFKAKVVKSLERSKNYGFKQEIMYAKAGAPTDNAQAMFYAIPGNSAQSGLFSPVRVLNSASVLFNAKADDSVPTATADTFNHNTKVTVKKQWANFTLTNNFKREVCVKIFDIAAKGKTPPTTHPQQYWADGLSVDKNDLGTATGINLSDTAQTHLGLSPLANKMFRNQFKVNESTVRMEPGNTHRFNITGPQMTYDMSKYHDGNTNAINDNWGMTRWILIVYYFDLVIAGSGTGRWFLPVDGEQVGLCLETTLNYVIEAPSKTGFENGPAPLPETQTLNLNKDAYHYAIYNGSAGQATSRVDEQGMTFN